MAKKNMKYTDEELNAMKINAMLQGIDPSTIQNEEIEEEVTDIEIEDEKPKKSRGKAKKQEEKKPVEVFVETRPGFENIKKSTELNVTFNQHDIHYKEQLWPIPARTVVYNLSLVTNRKVARDLGLETNGNNEEAGQQAYDGFVRYYKIVTYENVLNSVRELGCVRVFLDANGKLKSKAFINKNRIKEINVNPDTLLKNVQNAISNVIK